MNEINLILDIDSTLIANFGQQIRARGHLARFLYFCFLNFKTVSIWTAAEFSWFNIVNKALFEPIMVEISKSLKKKCSFRFVYVRPQGKIKYVIRPQSQIQAIFIKDLHDIWNQKWKFPEFNQYNTIIVDDTPDTFSHNYRNAFRIQPLSYNDTNDIELIKLMIYWTNVLTPHYRANGSVLNLDKHKWEQSLGLTQSAIQYIYNLTYETRTSDSNRRTSATTDGMHILNPTLNPTRHQTESSLSNLLDKPKIKII
jgi:hypothetical protein